MPWPSALSKAPQWAWNLQLECMMDRKQMVYQGFAGLRWAIVTASRWLCSNWRWGSWSQAVTDHLPSFSWLWKVLPDGFWSYSPFSGESLQLGQGYWCPGAPYIKSSGVLVHGKMPYLAVRGGDQVWNGASLIWQYLLCPGEVWMVRGMARGNKGQRISFPTK